MKDEIRTIKVTVSVEFGNIRIYNLPDMGKGDTFTRRCKELANCFGETKLSYHRTEKYFYTSRDSYVDKVFLNGLCEMMKLSWIKDRAVLLNNNEELLPLRKEIVARLKNAPKKSETPKKSNTPKVAPQNAASQNDVNAELLVALKTLNSRLDSIETRLTALENKPKRTRKAKAEAEAPKAETK